MTRRTLLVIVIALATLLATGGLAVATTNQEAQQQLLWMLNEERAERGLPGMQPRTDVEWVATDHSGDMADENRLYHNEAYFSDASFARLHAGKLGENVGYGPSMQWIHDALMNSETHRANMLDPRFSVVGIGVVQRGERWWVTQDFVEPER